MEEIEKHLDRTRFAWIGKMDEDSSSTIAFTARSSSSNLITNAPSR
jgi:hypothetical protein